MKRIILKPWQSILLHVILPAALTLVLFAGSLFLYTLPQFEAALYEDHKSYISETMDIIYSLAGNYYQRAQSGELTMSEAQYRFKERLRSIRYGPEDKDYFWINDLEERMIMHPYRPDLEGRDLTDFRDQEGHNIFLQFNEAAREGSGYVEYFWQWQDDPNRVMPKVSYVRLFEPWGWVIGTGFYVEEMQGQINALTEHLNRTTAFIFLIVSGLCAYLIWQGVRTEIQRQTAESELTQSFERFKRVMDSLDAIVYVSDTDTHEVLFVNKRGLELAPGSSGGYCWQILHEDQTAPCECCRLRGGDSKSHVRQFFEPHQNRWYEGHDQLIKWVDGRTVCLEIVADITDRKMTEQERENLLHRLSIKNEELQSLVYAASHDLRSPLINIQGFSKELANSCGRLTNLLRRPEGARGNQTIVQAILDEEIPESLEFIGMNTEKMQTLVNGLLQLSRIGTAKLNFKSLDMNAMINDVLTACGYQIKTIGAEITVESLPRAFGDYNQINQVFTNLIDNALKYRQIGRDLKISIGGRIVGNQAEYAVTDNGIGIAEIHLGRIFELFQQLKPSTSASEGVGLGLTIVKRILDIHNGSIRAESRPGKGSTFFVTLPKG